jgi:hypothetical protein
MEPPSSILQWKHRAENSWYLETLALAGSLISLLVMVALLFRFDGSPTFHWYGLSLNTIVSISSTASKAWLLLAVSEAISQWKWIMFSQMRHRLRDFEVVDSASRGPLGCFEVLARRTGGSVHVSAQFPCFVLICYSVALALGALITILTLAMDPFAQQLLGVHSEMHYIPQSNATLAIARRYAKAITRDSLYPGELISAFSATMADNRHRRIICIGLRHASSFHHRLICTTLYCHTAVTVQLPHRQLQVGSIPVTGCL